MEGEEFRGGDLVGGSEKKKHRSVLPSSGKGVDQIE